MLTTIEIDKELTKNRRLETATFGMGCFWGPEARFGSLSGVIRTRVGYTGGTTAAPTYKTMEDHTETVEIDYDPTNISYGEILQYFWRNHYPNRDQYRGQQYVSSLRYHNQQQKQIIDLVKGEMEKELGEPIETEITPLSHFTLAEDRHQKYYLRRYPNVLEKLHSLYPSEESLIHSTFAARLNGFVKGFGTRDQIVTEIKSWPLQENAQQQLIEKFMRLKW
ncbi:MULTISPECIES: peptide-methionine (S)-S-oxide reductase MsrA [unclassified Sporosarcina]|uniref:peptide-methionine (S)-S-oxide reductase MsrA n=1 Tax=unclassified Sporosarcina TaxID=2647733 RepID=UPI000C1655AB|nr:MULTISPECIES: peptide-methionine (S)-S-oxide reductase MsrA [unclassified Sporosarcina]PIC99120.1 peptide-methionine (S)-S-oxide reductase [Sporosarcina sp. P29]PID05586.1 peptide-methionine (S)-S-oxide reductase [Sporosarcina sp. P30]PID08780.1 peptide-methionine (S)-S-oxide reductase [Sporosarcina sp. P31]PID11952.1 peptide-methionine (S)-S-oxide reductase [Sporosarcina sp. P32b]